MNHTKQAIKRHNNFPMWILWVLLAWFMSPAIFDYFDQPKTEQTSE